jgi:hypothetical protein
MYKLRYYSTGQQLIAKYFETLGEAINYSVYNTPFQSFYGIDLIEE